MWPPECIQKSTGSSAGQPSYSVHSSDTALGDACPTGPLG